MRRDLANQIFKSLIHSKLSMKALFGTHHIHPQTSEASGSCPKRSTNADTKSYEIHPFEGNGGKALHNTL